MLPYPLISLVASLILGVWYVALADASRRSKVVVSAVVVAGLILGWRYPRWILIAILLQVAVSLYVLIYVKVNAGAS